MNDTQDIAKAILEDRCIFICGSELSAINGRQPNNKKIVEFFIDYYWKDKFPGRFNKQELLDKSLQEVAQIYFDSVHANDIQFVANQIKNQFLRKYIKKDLDPCATHLLLANLGVREIYTTNYDNLIEKAFTSVGFSEINVINHNNFSELNSKGLPNIYKLCGTIGDSDIILMEKQFSETDPNRLHYPFMRQLLDKIVVFIGYNNRDHVILSA